MIVRAGITGAVCVVIWFSLGRWLPSSFLPAFYISTYGVSWAFLLMIAAGWFTFSRVK